jgi:hypothetical protein
MEYMYGFEHTYQYMYSQVYSLDIVYMGLSELIKKHKYTSNF